MKKIFWSICTLALTLAISDAKAQEVTNVTTHDHITITTDVSQGTNSFIGWGTFPEENESIRRIKMQVTLGHPDSLAIAHWDYLDFINIKKTGGTSGQTRDIELGRLITPYGSSFTKDWSYTWEVDVTDFSSLLRDSVLIEFVHNGWEPEKLGWELTVNFEIQKGPEIAKQIKFTELYKGDFPYGNIDDPVENYLTPISFQFEDQANFGRIRIQHTGHGFGKPDLCSEFCTRWREVVFNDQVIDKRHLWKECGDNPLYPQGGTWIYDRGHWCPGDLQDPDVFQIPAKKGTNSIDIDMMPYVDSIGEVEGREIVTAYLIQYAAPNNKFDVAMEEIMVPNKKQNYGRMNPAVFEPAIRFRNLGSEPLKELKIKYGTEAFKAKTFKWTGNLNFNEETTLYLPEMAQFNEGENIYSVELIRPNGKKDQWQGDNQMKSVFHAPKQLPTEFVVTYKTNNNPEENHLFLINAKKDTVYQRMPSECEANTLYQDTLKLEGGLYEFELTDSEGNGLEFWAQPDAGYGYLRFLDLEGNILHHFVSDCGNGQFLSFEATTDAKKDTTVSQNAFFIYPRRTKDKLELDGFLEKPQTMRVQFMSDGTAVETHEYTNFKQGTFEYSLSYLPAGRYVVEIYVEDQLVHKDRINRD